MLGGRVICSGKFNIADSEFWEGVGGRRGVWGYGREGEGLGEVPLTLVVEYCPSWVVGFLLEVRAESSAGSLLESIASGGVPE